jgi:hypothetical protein
MMPQLSGVRPEHLGVASMVGLFYWGYSPFSSWRARRWTRWGRGVVPIGAATVGIGALLFATGDSQLASVGRLLQGAGGVFALVGARLHRHHEPRRRARPRSSGATQRYGMAGGSAGHPWWVP